MYRHLMVPLDDSPLSFDSVRKAVERQSHVQTNMMFTTGER